MKSFGIRFIIGLLIVIIILFLALLLIIFINIKMDKQTIKTAEKYLAEKYGEEMVLENFFKDIVDLNCNLTFHKKENPDFKFTVYMSKIRLLAKYEIWKDDYMEKLICYGLEERYTPLAESIWGEGVRIGVTTPYITKIDKVFSYLNEYSTIDDVKDNGLDKIFILFIDIPYLFEEEDKEKETEKILKFINIIQKDEYLPKDIGIERLKNEIEPSKKSITNTETCWIDDIENITGIEQIYEFINQYWFKEK